MAVSSPRKIGVDHLKHIPIYIGLIAILLSLPTILVHLNEQQNLEKFAQSRNYVMPRGLRYVKGQIIVKYRPNVEIKTNASVNQHKESFGVNDISGGLSNTSVNNLEAVGTRKMSRVFRGARLPQEKNVIQNLLGLVGAGPKPDPLANYVVINIPTNTDEQNAINLLIKDPTVESIEPDLVSQTVATPNDPQYAQQWAPSVIQLPQAWDQTTGSNNIKVAVIDTGVDLNHPDLQANLLPGTNFVTPGASEQDDYGHGTAVSGVIGAVGNNNVGIAGVNWQVKILPIKASDNQGISSESGDAGAIVYAADHGAKVINMSFGEDTSAAGGIAPQTEQDAIAYAASKGVVLIAAAGNSHKDAQTFYPAAFPQVIAVSATNQSDQLASFSNFGQVISVAAPGAQIFMTMWPGNNGSMSPACASQSYCSLNGTSFASPMVAGLAALILAKNPNLTADQVRNILQSTADDLGTPGKDPSFGYGRINAAKAIAAAAATPSPSGSATASSSSSPTPSSSISPTPSNSSGASPSPSISSLSQVKTIAEAVAANCGGKAVITKQLTQTGSAGTHWISYTAFYGGTNFLAQGTFYIYVKQVCSVGISQPQAITLTLQAGWNRVSVNGNCQGVQVQPINGQSINVYVQQACSVNLSAATAQTLNLQPGWNNLAIAGAFNVNAQSVSSVQQTKPETRKTVLDLILGR